RQLSPPRRSGNLTGNGRRGRRDPSEDKDMGYFVTGATGFIGRFLVARLLKRKGTIHVLVRKDSQKKFDAIAKKMGWDMRRITVLHGDMAAARCGLTAPQVRALKGKVKHFLHLAAIYDLGAGAEDH